MKWLKNMPLQLSFVSDTAASSPHAQWKSTDSTAAAKHKNWPWGCSKRASAALHLRSWAKYIRNAVAWQKRWRRSSMIGMCLTRFVKRLYLFLVKGFLRSLIGREEAVICFILVLLIFYVCVFSHTVNSEAPRVILVCAHHNLDHCIYIWH